MQKLLFFAITLTVSLHAEIPPTESTPHPSSEARPIPQQPVKKLRIKLLLEALFCLPADRFSLKHFAVHSIPALLTHKRNTAQRIASSYLGLPEASSRTFAFLARGYKAAFDGALLSDIIWCTISLFHILNARMTEYDNYYSDTRHTKEIHAYLQNQRNGDMFKYLRGLPIMHGRITWVILKAIPALSIIENFYSAKRLSSILSKPEVTKIVVYSRTLPEKFRGKEYIVFRSPRSLLLRQIGPLLKFPLTAYHYQYTSNLNWSSKLARYARIARNAYVEAGVSAISLIPINAHCYMLTADYQKLSKSDQRTISSLSQRNWFEDMNFLFAATRVDDVRLSQDQLTYPSI